MDTSVILVKTEKGLEELSTRRYKLNPRLRAILIVIGGKTTFGELLEKFKSIQTVESDLNALIKHEFIRAALDFKKQRMALSHIITDILGPGADMITMQLEDCKSIDELSFFVTEKKEMLNSVLGARAELFWNKFKEFDG